MNPSNDFDDAVINREVIIAHRFGHMCQPTYSMRHIVNQINNGLRIIDIDISKTVDNVYYVSHGNCEEYLSNDIPPTITSSSLKNSFIARGNLKQRYAESLPTLQEFWSVIDQYNVTTFIECKFLGDSNDLITYMKSIGMNENRIVVVDFDIDQIIAFKNSNYRTGLALRSINDWNNLSTVQKNACNYVVGKITIISDINSIGKPAIVYTLSSPDEWNVIKNAYSNVFACFTDCPLPTIHRNIGLKAKNHLMLLDPTCYHIALQTSTVSDNATFWCESPEYGKLKMVSENNTLNNSFQVHSYTLRNTFWGCATSYIFFPFVDNY
jgi:glycerophosphoryl diester phosphodiesterase